MASMSNPIRKLLGTPFVAGLLVSSCVFALCANDAMAQRGGGGRGGSGGSASHGGGGGGGIHGGRQAQSSVSSSYRGGGGGNRSSASGNTANRSGNTASRSNTTNRTNNSNRTTNVGSNNNVNINRGDVNVDIDGGGYNNGCCRARYPIAAGVAIGAVAGMTAAAVGSYYYGLPAGCGQVMMGGIGYYQCGSAYYQQSMNGDQVVYVAVNP